MPQYRYSLQRLFIAISAIGVVFGMLVWIRTRAMNQRFLVERITASGGSVEYDSGMPPRSSWLASVKTFMGDDYFYNVVAVRLAPNDDLDYSFLSELRHVRHFDASDVNGWDDLDLKVISAWPLLEYVCLDGTSVTDEGVTSLGELRFLRKVSLAHTQITERSIDHVLASYDLEHLDVSGTVITKEAIYRLLKAHERRTHVEVEGQQILSLQDLERK